MNRLMEIIGFKDRKEKSVLDCPYLTSEAEKRLVEATAHRTVEMLENKIYLRVGRGVVHKLLWLIGFVVVSIAAWLHAKGII